MFLRRKKRAPHHWLRQFVWPTIGWRRATRYLGHRVARLPGTPYSLAAGLACGAAISFTPFVGLHFALAAVMAWSLRASVIASAIGTAVGNPWTFPFIWMLIYRLGTWMGASGIGPADHGQDFSAVFGSLLLALLRLDFESFFDKVWPVWWPMVIGSLPAAIAVWVLSYLVTKPLIAAYQRRRIARRARRAARRGARREVGEGAVGKEVQG